MKEPWATLCQAIGSALVVWGIILLCGGTFLKLGDCVNYILGLTVMATVLRNDVK